MPHRPPGEFTAVEPLLKLCQRGKLYEVEEWIAQGKPIQFPPPDDRKLQRCSTPLQVAVGRGFHSLAGLLLANGYDPNGDYYECLSPAVHARDHDMVELLFRFGTDPRAADFCDVLETCDRALMDRFIAAGVNPCHGNAVARATTSSRRPIFGFIKQYRDRFPCLQRQIDIALRAATSAEHLRTIALLLWVGANPHAKVPSSPYEDDGATGLHETAFEEALWSTKPEILTMFMKKPIPLGQRAILIECVSSRSRPELVRQLLTEGIDPNAVNEDGYPLLYGFIHALLWCYASREPDEVARGFDALELMLQAGAKWSLTERQLKSLRRDLADAESSTVIRLLEMLRQHGAVSPEQLHELTRTPAVRRVLNGVSKPQRNFFGIYQPPPPVRPAPVVSRFGSRYKR